MRAGGGGGVSVGMGVVKGLERKAVSVCTNTFQCLRYLHDIISSIMQ